MRTKISRMMRGHALPAALVMMSLSTLAGCGMDDAILDDTYIPASYQERHPIRVVEKPVTIAIRASAGGLGPSQMNEVINFANDARMHSKSVISVRVAGGSAALSTLQTAAIIAALPFSLIMVLMCIAIIRCLSLEHKAENAAAL